MAFFRNPLNFAKTFVRQAISGIGGVLRAPLRVLRPETILGEIGGMLGTIGRRLASFGAAVEAGALRREALREAQIASAAGAIQGLPPGVIITDANIPEAVTKIRRRYSWTIRVRYIDPTTGETRERFITVSTDRPISTEEAVRAAQEETFPESPKIAGAIIDTEVIRVVRAGRGGTL